MSTKSTIWLSEDATLHVFAECFDESGAVHIEFRINDEYGCMETAIRLPPHACRYLRDHLNRLGDALNSTDSPPSPAIPSGADQTVPPPPAG